MVTAAGASAAAIEDRGETATRGAIRVALAGERGKTGAAVAVALAAAPDIDYAGGFGSGVDAAAFLREHRPQVLVDFSLPSAAPGLAFAAIEAGAAPVIGTTGVGSEIVDEIEAACGRAGLGGVVAPNFAIGAVVMMWLAAKAGPHFDGVEIVEAHPPTKLDKPSGTAIATARRLGGEVPVHALRIPGVVANQEVLFGLPGQTLAITHRTTSREAYGPGVLLAVRQVVKGPRFYRGLDELLDLK